jgi:hypothetical protein
MEWSREEIDAIEQKAMERNSMDGILVSEEAIVPSSGFLAAVMERVRDEAQAPAPIPFPWKRAVPGLALAAGVFGWGAVELVRMGIAAGREGAMTAPQFSVAMVLPLQQAGWVALGLGFSLGSWLLARRLAGGPGVV